MFFGDSLIEFMPIPKLPEAEIVNAGYSGMGVSYLVHRVEALLKNHQPDKVFLCIGINDVWELNSPEAFAGWQAEYNILCQALTKGTSLYLSTLMPVEKSGYGALMHLPAILQANEIIKQFSVKYNCNLLDSFAHFAGEDNYMPPRGTEDGVHLTMDIYKRWIKFILQGMELR